MKRKKSIIIMSLSVAIVAIIAVLCLAIMPQKTGEIGLTPNYSYGKTEVDSSIINSGDKFEKNEESDNSNADNTNEESKDALTYYVNEHYSTKVVEISGETKIFKLSFSLFIQNNQSVVQKIMLAGFLIRYDISEFGTYLSCDCTNHDGSEILDAGEINEFKFEVSYVIFDNNFDGSLKNNLNINYFGQEVYSVIL